MTVRVVLFGLLVIGVVVAAYLFVRWYANDNWYVTAQRGQLVIYQGRPGGLLWFDPRVVDRTSVPTSEVLPIHLRDLGRGHQEASLADARRYVSTLHQEFIDQKLLQGSAATASPPSSTSALPPTPGSPSQAAP